MVSEKNLPPLGEIIGPEDLDIAKAKELVAVAKKMDFIHLIECRKYNKHEIIIVSIEPELSQVRINDIRYSELISIEFDPEDIKPPEILALRESFPYVPHLNLRVNELPRSLCLFETPYNEQKIYWTAVGLLQRVREWLTKTSMGTLHEKDQPLEPFLFSSSRKLILPLNVSDSSQEYIIYQVDEFSYKACIKNSDDSNKPIIFLRIDCAPQLHGVIQKSPRTIEDLTKLNLFRDRTLIEVLREKMIELKSNELLEKNILFLLSVPMKRTPDSEPESINVLAFLTTSVEAIGIDIGLWDRISGLDLGLLTPPDDQKTGSNTHIVLLDPIFEVNNEILAKYNGIDPCKSNIIAVGVGALGSQVALNLARSGFGSWTLIDGDYFLPHNLARHALPGWRVGSSKSESVALFMASISESEPPPKAIHADIFLPAQKRDAIETALNSADLVLDMAASVAVSRHLVYGIQCKARRISVFLNPTGTDLVILSEDTARNIALDQIEYTYYRALALDENLSAHFKISAQKIGYSLSCRDRSNVIPQTNVALLSAIASKKIIELSKNINSFAGIWQIQHDMSIIFKPIPTTPYTSLAFGDWTVFINDLLIMELNQAREKKLPTETGGVLLGGYDHQRKILYLVHHIPAPTDSEAGVTYFIRGKEGLRENVEKIRERTHGNLEYIGEWHSHPVGTSCDPSRSDQELYSWLETHKGVEAPSPIMLIIGEKRKYLCWFNGIQRSVEY